MQNPMSQQTQSQNRFSAFARHANRNNIFKRSKLNPVALVAFQVLVRLGVKIDGILSKRELPLDQIHGTVAVDSYNVLYQFLSIIRQKDGTPLMDAEGRVTSHISGLFYRTCNLLERGIKPIYVFDGKPSILKERTVQERSERKQDALEKFLKAQKEGDEEDMRVYSMQATRLEGHMVDEAKELLGYLGVPVVQAKTEAEAQCAHMSCCGAADAAASQDFDSLLFGAKVLIRNLTIAGKRKLPRSNQMIDVLPEKFVLQESLDALSIDRQKLVWIALLCGTDFNKGVYGIGAKKGYKLVKAANSFEEVLTAAQAEIPRWKEIEGIFLRPDVFDPAPESIRFGEPQKEALEKFMCTERGFSKERVDAALSRAFKIPEDSRQNALSKWM